jgi:RNA polymerase sigma-70 factor (ECF subfamily)
LDQEEITELFQEFYEGWYSSLVRYAARATGSTELAKDLVQESFLLLCRELLRGTAISSPKGWTFRIVRRHIRRQREWDPLALTSVLPLDDASAEQDFRVPVGSPTDAEPDDLSRFLSYLSSREEEVILLRLEGFKYREIAQQLEIGTDTVKTLLARAMKKMQGAAQRNPADSKQITNEGHVSKAPY